jgi:hypothetical protein
MLMHVQQNHSQQRQAAEDVEAAHPLLDRCRKGWRRSGAG